MLLRDDTTGEEPNAGSGRKRIIADRPVWVKHLATVCRCLAQRSSGNWDARKPVKRSFAFRGRFSARLSALRGVMATGFPG
jgi:hypothetical protein